MFNNPNGVAVDAAGVVYVADTANNRVRRIGTDGVVSTVAGDSTPGLQNGSGSQARFNAPQGVAVDSQGTIYVADTGNAAVRKIDLGGTVTTLAGDGTVGSTDSPNARFDGVVGIAVEGQSIYVYLADTGNHRIRRLDVTGTVITVSGAERGFKDGSAGQARFAEPSGIALEADGKIIVADGVNSLIRSVDPVLAANGSNQAVSTLAGSGVRGSSDGNGDAARFFTPRGLAVSNSSAIIVADTGNQLLRRILLPPMIVSIDPSSARVGDTVTIHGARFDGRGPERNVVRFTRSGGGTTFGSVTQATRTTLSVVVPSDAATGPMTVETEGGTAISPNDFVVNQVPAPVITDFNPKRGIVGTQVVLTGTNLKVDANDPSVTFAGGGGRLPALVTNASATQVQVTVPNGAITGLIELTHAGGTTATATPFTVDSEQDFVVTVAPSTTTAVQGGSGTYVVYVTSTQSTFSQLASLTATGLPAGITATFNPAQITAGASATLTLKLSGTISPGSYPFTIRGVAPVGGNDLERTAGATLNVMAGGQTTLSGRVLSTDNEPIVGATASLDGKTAMTDASGSFLLVGVTAGTNRPLMIDGRTANSPNKTYPVIIEPANIVAGQANVNPYTFYLPPIDTQYEVEVVPGQNTVASNPRVPGLSMTIPAGANLRNRDGSPVARVSITPLAIDRTPAPLPANVSTGLVYTSQPGGALSDIPMPVIYPNLLGTNPGTQVNLYAFNHDTVQWYVYGTGTVSNDGRTIVPNINPSTGRPYGLPDFSWHFPSAAAPGGNPGKKDDCPRNRSTNPVDFSTGVKVEEATDVAFAGSRGGLSSSRVYTSDLGRRGIIGAFGSGWKDNYDFRLTGSFVVGGSGRLATPEEETGELFSYTQTDASGALVFTTRGSVSQLGDVLRKLTDGTFEYRLAGGNFMRFGTNGRLIAIGDPNGNTTTLSYTGNNLTNVADAVGRSLVFDYDAGGRRTRMTDPLGRQWQYGYVNGRLATVTDPLSGVMRYGYDAQGQLISVTDKRGNLIKEITYLNGQVTQQKFADGGIERYEYTFAGAIITSTTITSARGNKRTLRFNANGYVTETVDRLGQRAQINRDLMTNTALSTTGPCGCAETTSEFDARGNLTSATDRIGGQTRMEYEPVFNRPIKITDKQGRITSFTYDTRGNLTSMTNVLGQTITYSYNGFGQLTGITDPLSHTENTEYDGRGNISAMIDPLGHRVILEHDVVGRLTAQVDALGRRSTREYDALDRIVKTTDSAGMATRYFYDASDNLVKVMDSSDHSWTASYDAKNRMVSTTDALGHVSRMAYDLANNVTDSITPSGRRIRNTYDQRGQLDTMTDPLGNVVVYKKDSRGNLTSITDPRGHVTTFLYDELFRTVGMRDPLGRLSSVRFDADNRVTESIDRLGRRVNYNYDAGNRLTQVTFADAVVSYTYDGASRMTGIDDTQSGSVEWSYDSADRLLSETTPNGVVSYAYNDANQMTSMTAADRPPVNYIYDTAGRLQTIAQGTENFTYAYDAFSRLASLQRPNGVETRYQFDAIDRLTRLTHVNGANQPIEDYLFTYTVDNQINAITSLASVTHLPAPKTVGPSNGANRITQFGETSYSFDERGMTTSKATSQGTTNYQWDARGRLTRVTLPDNQVISYGYDALGRRASRTAGGETTSFLYDQAEVVLDRASNSQMAYLNSPGIDDKLRQTNPQTGPLYFLQDHLRSTTALTDSSGSVVERTEYEAFGGSSGSSLTRFTFTGRERDNLSGLMYFRARWYDPEQGRFLSEDPAGFAGGLNKYAYANNNPINKTDPLGLFDIDVHYYLTYYLARKSGCFEDWEARLVAEGDQRSDEDSDKSPGSGLTIGITPDGSVGVVPDWRQQQANMDFHAFGTDAQNARRANELYRDAVRSGDPRRLGTYLHFLQDEFSHYLFAGNPVTGQLSEGHSVDHTTYNPYWSMEMAKATWEKIKQYGKNRGCPCKGEMSDGDWKIVKDFIDVGYDQTTAGGRAKAIAKGVNDEHLRRKIEILNVPWRSANGRDPQR
jgi:RHS repeat-associated protein